MAWKAGNNYGSWTSSGRGKKTQHLIGICVNRGPDGQRYMVKYNELFGWIITDTFYVWCDWNENENDPIINLSKGTKADWNSCWEQGFHPYVPPVVDPEDSEPTPDPTLTSQTFSSILQIDWRIALAVAITVLAMFYAVIVIKQK